MTGSNPGFRQVLRVVAALAILSILTAAPDVVAWIEAQYPMSGGAASKAFQSLVAAVVAWLLFVATLLAWGWPSWAIATRLRPDDALEVRTLRACVISFFLQPAIHTAIIGVGGRLLSANAYHAAVLAAQGVLLLAAAVASTRHSTEQRREFFPRLLVLSGVTLLATLALIGRIAWADLNPDGTELLTMGRMLGAFAVPRLPTGEIPGINLGMLPIAYPVDWLLAIGGLSPMAARLPALAYLTVIASGLVAIVEQAARRRLSVSELALLGGGVVAACLTIGFNASYDPYSTDLASPASIDLLALALLTATLYFLFAGEATWCIAAAMLQALSRPSAPLLCLMVVAAIMVVERDLRSRRLQLALVATATTLVVTLLYVFVFERLTGTQVSEGGGNLLLRLRFLRFDDWARLAYLVVPAGVLPALLLWRWRQSDQVAKVLTLVTLAYFAFFYSLAFISLHHFAPAMLLPLVVFWRGEVQRDSVTSVPMRIALAAGVAIALGAAMPTSLTPFRATRDIGRSIAFDMDNVTGYPLVLRTYDGSRVLDSLFTPYFRVRDAQVERVGDPITLALYAIKAGTTRDSAKYVVQPDADAPPPGTTALATARGFTLYARDVEAWQRQRKTPPPPDVRSRLYDVPRTTLFQHLGRDAGLVQVDLRSIACWVVPGMRACAVVPTAANPGWPDKPRLSTR